MLGQWINGVSTESGSNNLLDDFEFTTNHLPGDVNQDLSVDTVDQKLLIAPLMLGVSPEYTIFKDFDGNQAVSVLERVALHSLKGSKLP